MGYPVIPNTVRISKTDTVGRPESSTAIPDILLSPPRPTPRSKNIFAFWNTGLLTMPPYLLRNILAWHHRLSALGWNIYVLDTQDSSTLNVASYVDTSDSTVVPDAFRHHQLNGEYAAQHTSDLVRYPLLLKYGGVYLDVGILQFGDLDWLWTQHIANPESPYDFAGFAMGEPPHDISIVNFALVCGAGNPLMLRAHKILLKLWEGKTNTNGMHSHPLVSHVPLMHVPSEVMVSDDVGGKMLINDEVMTDYAIQIQCMGSAQRWVDPDDGWDGPRYVRERCWLYSMLDNSMLFEQIAGWSGKRAFDLLSLRLVSATKQETDDHKMARQIVEMTVARSWCLKLGHGFSAKLFGGDTLGMCWRKHEGSDCKQDTYAGWLRWAESNLAQEEPPLPLKMPVYEATKAAKLYDYLTVNVL